jgi:hypothetical protein
VASNDRLLNNSEAAAMLGCKPGVLVRLRNAGIVPYVNLENTRDGFRYSLRALEMLIQKNQRFAKPSNKAA